MASAPRRIGSPKTRLGLVCALLAGAALLIPAMVSADARDQARRIHDRIAGVPPDPTTNVLQQMQDEIELNNDPVAAALIATQDPGFYNVTLKNFAAPWTNRDRSVFVPLNDYTATVIGMVRDNVDFRQILYGDIIYVGTGVTPGYSNSSNAHYEAIESQGLNLATVLTGRTQSSVTGIPATATAGVLTSRAASKAFFIDGTNRAMFRFTMLNHLCNDMEQVQDIHRSPDRIRQDVSRSPGGDSRVFLNGCIGCHSGMDPMAQSFAYYDYVYDDVSDPAGDNGQLVYSAGTVVSKYFNNNTTFPFGFVTPNDDWANYWREGVNSLLGWDPALTGSGTGAKSMGQELAHSQAFAQCQVKKVFRNVCLRDPSDDADRNQIDAMVANFESSGYSLRRVFAESATYCMGN
jgi:hypothetical protein